MPVRKTATRIGDPDELFLQLGENGGVQVDAFWRDAMSNEIHDSKEVNEDEYESIRRRYRITEQATLPPFSSFKSGNTVGRVVGETALAAVPATQANPPIEAETENESIIGEQVLDGIQLGLDVVGLIPVVGEAADITSAGISLARGDYMGAGLSLLSAIPFVGYLGAAGKAAGHGAKMADASGRAAKEAAEKKQKRGGKITSKKLPKKKPACFDPGTSKKYKKMNEVEQKEYRREYARQLKRQEGSINNMSAKDFARARSKFNETKAHSPRNDGRNPKAAATQDAYRSKRAKAIERSIYQSTIRKNPKVYPRVAESTAAARTKEIMGALTALHDPDMVAGGWYEPKPSALGNKSVNSAIGGSWSQQGRVKLLEEAANNAVARGDGSDIMNVELAICPPSKKGK